MNNSHYTWQRFWVPRGKSIKLIKGGYMSGERRFFNPEIKMLSELMDHPCLILLGEPGLGKSRTINTEYKTLASLSESPNEQYHFFNLNTYRSEELLIKRLFESKEFYEWISGTHRLHLFLDSLDECLLRIDTVAALLVEEFSKYPKERLLLRIACRSADWPSSLEAGLDEIWKRQVSVYELCPLREEDVALAAKIKDVKAEEFLTEVTRKDAVPFAVKPVTLNFLFGLYYQNGELPNRQSDLYERGCRLLAEEGNQNYRDSRVPRQLTADQRMLVAGRIAAVTIFSNKAAIWQSVESSEIGAEDVTVRELCGYAETLIGQSFEITEVVIKEALGTGLFSLRDENRMGWAHQTYAEFLAAWYLFHSQLAPDDVMQLLTVEQEVSGRVAPQLQETAARLAVLMPEVFQQIMKSDPDILLRSDVAAVSPAFREALVNSLLEVFRAEQASDKWFDRNNYCKLAHPKLAEQLRPIISNKQENFLVRRVAIDIAEECDVKDVLNDLVTLALDQTDFLPTRIQAACAISKIGDNVARLRLKPFVTDPSKNDPDNELLGYGLKSLWPDLLAAKDVFAALVEPRVSFFGAYYVFLVSEFVPHLKQEDIPVALNWVASQQYCFHELSSLKDVGDKILINAWNYLDSPEILTAFARAAFARLKARHEIIDPIGQDSINPFVGENRRHVLREMITLIENVDSEWIFLVRSRYLFFVRSDISWLLEILAVESSKIMQETASCLLARLFGNGEVEPEYLNAISAACRQNEILAAHFSFYIEFGSPQAQQAKSNYEMMQEYKCRSMARQPPLPLSENPLLPMLEQFEQGDLSAWWKLNLKLDGGELETDLTVTPNWHRVDDEGYLRIIAAAKRYILEADPGTNEWLGTKTIYRPAFSGYRALVLLLKTDPSFIAKLIPNVWRKWAPIIISYPYSSSQVEVAGNLHQELTNLAYQYAPEVVIETLAILIGQRNEGNDIWLDFDRLENCWDNRLRSAILEKAKDEQLTPNLFRQLLQQLLKRGDTETEVYAHSLLTLPLSNEGQPGDKVFIAAQELFLFTPDAAWEIIWSIFQQDIPFGKKVVESIVERLDDHSVISRLNEQAAADLYIWLSHQYPHAEDPDEIGCHFVTTRMSISHWRNAIPHNLMNRGTAAACLAIEKIIHALPQLEWLKYVLLDAQKNRRRKEWSPLSPQTLISITAGGQRMPFPLPLAATSTPKTALELAAQDSTIDNESRELILVGHVYSISAEAGQIYRGYTNSDHGIDGEIEFKDDALQASGKRLYMQLKSGDSYLTTRKRDGAEIFQVKNERWVKYWQAQAYPVMLVIRNSDGEIRWMDVTEYLRGLSDNGKKPVTQIIFQGERFDVMSVRRWRDKLLGKPR